MKVTHLCGADLVEVVDIMHATSTWFYRGKIVTVCPKCGKTLFKADTIKPVKEVFPTYDPDACSGQSRLNTV